MAVTANAHTPKGTHLPAMRPRSMMQLMSPLTTRLNSTVQLEAHPNLSAARVRYVRFESRITFATTNAPSMRMHPSTAPPEWTVVQLERELSRLTLDPRWCSITVTTPTSNC